MDKPRISLFAILAAVPVLASAGGPPLISSVPTLGEFGLIGLAVGVGGLGAWLISRRK